MTDCRVYWGSHGCELQRGHDGPHVCGCCECPDHDRDHESEGCVAKPPYYGPETNFYGEDAPQAAPVDEPGRLTSQMVRAAMQRIKDDHGYHVCGRSDNHVVHPKAVGWTTCANCFGMVWAGPGEPLTGGSAPIPTDATATNANEGRSE